MLESRRLPERRSLADRPALDRPHGRGRPAGRSDGAGHAPAARPSCRTLVRRGVPPAEAAAFLAPGAARPAARPPSRCATWAWPPTGFWQARAAARADRGLRRLRRRWRRLGGAAADLAARDGACRPRSISPTGSTKAMARTCPRWRRWRASHDLILCVDCGTLSHDPIAAAKGADVVVLDHHLGAETLPAALAVVNPNRQDEDGSLGHLCAASVVFLMLVEANRQLRAAGRAGPGPDGDARSGGAGDGGRCGPADRRQPRAGAAGAEGDGAARAPRPCARWPMWRGWIRPRPPMRWASCWARG